MPNFTHQVIFRYGSNTLGLLALLVFLLLPQSYAAVVEDLYEVEIPVVDQSEATRRAAFNRGLREVLIRVTGDSKIFSLIKRPYSSPYVKQFQYRELDKSKQILTPAKEGSSSHDKSQESTHLLWVQFNETKVNDFVSSNALPLWGQFRSETVIWLAVNDGSNRYILKSTDNSLLKTVTKESATRRAIPLIWPDVSREERAIQFADIWGGFQLPIKRLSNEYSDGPIIVGRLFWKGKRWNSDWTLLLDDSKTDWAIEHADYNQLLTEAMDKVGDILGQQYALFDTGDIKSFHSLAIQINNIHSIVSLNDLKQYLSTVPMVQEYKLDRIENGSVFIDVSLRTNTDDFLKTIEQDSKLLRKTEEQKNIVELNGAGEDGLIQDEFVQGDSNQSNLEQAGSDKANSDKSDLAQADLISVNPARAISNNAAYQFQFQP